MWTLCCEGEQEGLEDRLFDSQLGGSVWGLHVVLTGCLTTTCLLYIYDYAYILYLKPIGHGQSVGSRHARTLNVQ